jgi:hypothetical protein
MSFSKLCPDLFNLICEKLNNKDLYSLYCVNEEIKKKITKFLEIRTLSSISKKLEEVFENSIHEFLRALKESYAVISGSFLLQNILNEFYEFSDVDIYIPTSLNFSKPSYKPQTPLDIFCKKHIRNANECCDYEDIAPEIDFVRNYKNDKIKIQLVFVNTECIKSFILKYFDFNVCKNIYDGNKLYIEDIKNLLNKEILFPSIDYFIIEDTIDQRSVDKFLSRIVKYKKRGFIVAPIDDETLKKCLKEYEISGYSFVSM